MKRHRDDAVALPILVASRAEAWVETRIKRGRPNIVIASPPARRRGLKQPADNDRMQGIASPPARRRGLKRELLCLSRQTVNRRLPRGGVG